MAKYNSDILNEYLRQGEPAKADNAIAWKTAIGLQQVDGLTPSKYLIDTAKRNIEGEISIDEAVDMINTYYQNKTAHTQQDQDEEEADKVSANIRKILSHRTLAFNTNGFIAVHRRIFEGVFKHAGELRTYDITKNEWVLDGDTVHYLNWEDLRLAIDYDLKQETEFSYKGLSEKEKIHHICLFVSRLWQIHPFGEGNTRATAVFLIQYLRSMGYKIDNSPFADHSWYFRNALVRANYRNINKGIDYDLSYLELFLRNLLLGEDNELQNRQLHIGWKKENVAENVAEELSERQKNILILLRKNVAEGIKTNTQFLSEKFCVNRKTIQRDMAVLAQKQLVQWQGSAKDGHWELVARKSEIQNK